MVSKEGPGRASSLLTAVGYHEESKLEAEQVKCPGFLPVSVIGYPEPNLGEKGGYSTDNSKLQSIIAQKSQWQGLDVAD